MKPNHPKTREPNHLRRRPQRTNSQTQRPMNEAETKIPAVQRERRTSEGRTFSSVQADMIRRMCAPEGFCFWLALAPSENLPEKNLRLRRLGSRDPRVRVRVTYHFLGFRSRGSVGNFPLARGSWQGQAAADETSGPRTKYVYLLFKRFLRRGSSTGGPSTTRATGRVPRRSRTTSDAR